MRELRLRATNNLSEGTRLSKCLGCELRPSGSRDCTDCSPDLNVPKGRPWVCFAHRCTPDAWPVPEGGSMEETLNEYLLGEGRKKGRGGITKRDLIP